ncbi:hypothetical protein BT96DRAFT_939718 [Gymnopus androsaceus JB14]|uniref:Uncharacterized protein n=1 Tax=Gymnopus androsaceus JB14 TaxID=1447944 RepID=A0A6A4HPV8_9AGAR|nr:hypothetical protein BT96DRAFT_939718 [Gymnopus androsaceus JB14]
MPTPTTSAREFTAVASASADGGGAIGGAGGSAIGASASANGGDAIGGSGDAGGSASGGAGGFANGTSASANGGEAIGGAGGSGGVGGSASGGAGGVASGASADGGDAIAGAAGSASAGSSITTSNSSSIAVTASSTAKASSSSSTSIGPKKTASAAVTGVSVAGSLIALLATGICILFILRHRRRRLRAEGQITPFEASSSVEGPLISEKHRTNVDQSRALQPVRPGHQPHVPEPVPLPESSGHRSEQLESPEGNDEVRSQAVASLHDSNAEMRTTIVRLMEHMRHLEAQMESGEAPPMYIPS